MPDWSDKRRIEELRFGTEWKPTLGELHAQQPGYGAVDAPFGLREGDPPGEEIERLWKEKHFAAREALLAILKGCNCATAGDIVTLGCTGAVGLGCTVDEAKFLRLGLGGSGVGLPCFVSPERYCLVHEVSGGLQDGQTQGYPNCAIGISRPLTAQEATESALVDHAKGATEAAASDLLSGRKLPEGWEHEQEHQRRLDVSTCTCVLKLANCPKCRTGAFAEGNVEASHVSQIPLSVLAESVWKCPEHEETLWACRYCVAQAIVEGDLQPTFAVRPAVGGFTKAGVPAGEAVDEVSYLDSAGAARVDLYVLAATFTRKLAR